MLVRILNFVQKKQEVLPGMISLLDNWEIIFRKSE